METLLQKHTTLSGIRKIGEGTFGEAYKGNGLVFKIVPMEGSTLVNGEVQKRADEILAEVLVALRLNGLRNDDFALEKKDAGVLWSWGGGGLTRAYVQQNVCKRMCGCTLGNVHFEM